MKLLDYTIYNLVVYGLSIDLRLAVLFTSGIVFTLRMFIYFRYVFAGVDDHDTRPKQSSKH